MEKLIVLSEDGEAQEFPLTGQRISIGRDEENLICLGDKSVSRHHATLQRVSSGFTIQDEGSTNGTRVNGRLISKQFLKHRDLIEIGKYHLRYLQPELEEVTEDTEKTTVMRRMTQPRQQVSNLVEAASMPAVAEAQAPDETTPEPQSEESTAKVCYLAGDRKGQEVVVDRAFFSVGNPGGDLVLINRRHTGYFLLKVGGEVPPTINGTPIKAGGVELHYGDRIDLGELSLEFRG
ncbi:MAG: FHA domain-containing protein [Candidatus Thiodiazotropha sp.]|jgi:pSer/pThr/pTyr-binding forkhead associated (FHA) protein